MAAAALAARAAVQQYAVWRAAPRLRRVFEGGFQSAMDRKEAAHILGIRCSLRCASPPTSHAPGSESAAAEKVKEAHRRIMVANHPDAGGSDFIASKINEARRQSTLPLAPLPALTLPRQAKEIMLKGHSGGRSGSSPF